jgi:DNA-binding MarR family transcriptional regulator
MTNNNQSHLVMGIINLQNTIQKRVGSALSVHGLGLTEFLVLNQLFSAPKQMMRRIDLAEQVGLSPSGITRLVNPMEKIGLINKKENPRDARVSLVALSNAGKRIYEEAKVSFEHASTALFEPLDTKQQSALLEWVRLI